MRLLKVGVLSVGTIFLVLYAGIGLIFGAIFSLVSLLGFASGISSGTFGALLGVGAIIFIPLVYGIIGFISGCLTAVLYNLAADWLGGIEMEFDNMPISQQ